MTPLRYRMLEELERLNYASGTAKAYLFAVKQFAEHFHRRPDHLGASISVSTSCTCFASGSWLRRQWRSEWPRYGSSTSRRSSSIDHTTIYLHLSRRHMDTVPNPLDTSRSQPPPRAAERSR